MGLPRVEAALVCLPNLEFFTERFGKPWTKVLFTTGAVDGVRVTARGTMAFASDGHLCRSLGELAVDDYLTSAFATVSHAASHAARQRFAIGPRLGTVIRFGGLYDSACTPTTVPEPWAVKVMSTEMG